MEVTVLEVSNPPSKPVLAIHAGSVRRQAKLEVNTPFVIPHPGSQTGPVEVSLFQQLTSKVLPNDNKPEALCSIPVKRLDGQPAELQLRIRRGEAAIVTDQAKKEANDTMGMTRDYLDRHQLQQRIQGLIQEVLREQPDNPYKYMVEQLRRSQGNGAAIGSSSESKESPVTPAKRVEEAKQPLVPRSPDKPKPDGPRGRNFSGKSSGVSGFSDDIEASMPSSSGKTSLQPPSAGRYKSQPSTEVQAAARFSVIQMLHGSACRKAAEQSLRSTARRVCAESLSLLVLNSSKEKVVAEVAAHGRQVRASMSVAPANVVLWCPKDKRAMAQWANHMAYRGACSILGYPGFVPRRHSLFGEQRRQSLPTPFVSLDTEVPAWGSWLN